MALPAYFCRECGASGWIGYKTKNSQCLETDSGKTAQAFIANNENCYLINLYSKENEPLDEYRGECYEWWIDPSDLHIYYDQGEPSEGRVHVVAIRKIEAGKNNKNPKFVQLCPSCCSDNTLAIIGTKVATLASVAISQVMSSDLDSESESSRKILAFTNSVQDAAHQAGFFEARNYRFSFRNALQKEQDVVTSSGIFGKIKDIDEVSVTLEIAQGMKIKVDKRYVNPVPTPQPVKPEKTSRRRRKADPSKDEKA